MDALRILASTGEQFNAIAEKVNLNHEIFQSEKKTLKDTILRFLRNIFGLEEPPVSYDIFITDKRTETKKKETIKYNEFYANLLKNREFTLRLSARILLDIKKPTARMIPRFLNI